MNTGVREQRDKVVTVIRMLQVMLAEIREAFARQLEQPLDQAGSEQGDIAEEAAFDAAEADEMMVGRLWRDREPFLRYQEILRQLKMIAISMAGLAETIRHQIREKISFSDKMMDEIGLLLGRQEMLLHSLSEMVSAGETGRSGEISRICHWMGQHCLVFATQHESRLVEGLCLPASAPVFLDILDRMQALVHHDLELIRLLTAWLDGKDDGTSDQRAEDQQSQQ